MKLLIRVRGIGPAIAVAVVACFLLILIGSAPMTIFAGTIAVPWAYLIPTIVAASALTITFRPFADWERQSTRRLRVLDVTLRVVFVVIVASLAATCVLVRDSSSTDLAVQIARNTSGLVGLTWVIVAMGGQAFGGIAPVCYSIVAILGGRDSLGDPLPWAWVIENGANWPAFAVALALGAAGSGVPLIPVLDARLA